MGDLIYPRHEKRTAPPYCEQHLFASTTVCRDNNKEKKNKEHLHPYMGAALLIKKGKTNLFKGIL
jgi:hypothetical protein